MGNIRKPRRGSMQFWPRKRSAHSVARIRSWVSGLKAKPLGFVGYKAGMTHLQVVDNRAKSLTKNEIISMPATIIECPPMTVCGVSFYKKSIFGLEKITSIFAEKLSKNLGELIQLPKKKAKSFDEIKEFEDLRLLVHTNVEKTGIGTKKPKLVEIALGGSKEEKVSYAKNILGKDISVSDVFDKCNQVDVHGISKGKGFQGTVKRFGVPIRQHKAEKTKRGIGTLGPLNPSRVRFSVPQSGKMGFHTRTEYNKQVLKIGKEGQEVNPSGGFIRFGFVKNNYLLLKGSVVGTKKRAVFLTPATRPNEKIPKDAPEITYLHK